MPDGAIYLKPPELAIINGDICTMEPLSARVTALAVTGGRISKLGANGEIMAVAESGTRVIDAGGRLVLPGFQDTHIHLQDGGLDHSHCAMLDSARSIGDIQQVMSEFSRSHARQWVNGVGWYTGIFTSDNLDRQVLDAAVPDRPCYIVASDGHNACLNTRACRLIGLEQGTPDPENGHFVVDGRGMPTGMLHENAISWAEARMPSPTDADYANGVRFGQALCNRHGITGVIDASVNERHARVYRSLERAGELTLRVAATAKVTSAESTESALERLQSLRRENNSTMFKVHSVKFFLDGVLENRTGVMLKPYSDSLGGNGLLMFGDNQVRDLFTAFDAARFQIHVHAIGDGAVRAALDGLEAARLVNGPWPSLHQIAHVQCIDPADVPRFRQLGAMANIQTLWARHEPSVTDVALPMVGQERGKWVYAFRSLIDAGAHYAISSDWGVSTLNPFQIMETAITRQPPGRHGEHPVFLPEQRMTREECVRGYTQSAAQAAWRDQDTGSLSVGKYADLIILDRNIFTCDVYDIGDTEVLLTILGGREVHRARSFRG